jgi:hypothetical protein
MKKILLSVLAIAAMTSCVQEQTINTGMSGAITFNAPFIEKANSRAAVDPSTTTGTISAFDVWGFMDQNTGTVFSQQRVNRTGSVNGTDKGIWSYNPLAYWTPNHTYRFAALAPVDDTNIQLELADNGKMSNDGALGTVTFTNVDGNVDLLYAQPAAITTGSDVYTNTPVVNLQFAHLLSKIKFTFTNGFPSEYNTMEVTNIRMQVPDKGSVDLTQTTRPYLWDIATPHNDITLSFGDAINKVDATKGVSLGSGESGECEFECLTLPIQNGTTIVPHLTVNFDVVLYQGDQVAIAKSTRTAKLVLDGSLVGLEKGLEQGKGYRINATLNSENVADGALLEIKFDEVTVDEWVEVEYDAGVIATL